MNNQNLKGKNVLVTGAAGFIGSHVVDELVKLGANVFAIDNLSGGFTKNINPSAHFMPVDITDQKAINSIFEKFGFEYVYHLAAYAAEGLSFFIPHFNYETNLIGSINLITASVNHGVLCFVFTSSIAVYGHPKNHLAQVSELTTPEPADPYGVSKLAVEMHLKTAFDQFGLNYVIFRPHNVFGPRQNIADRYRNVIGIFMNQVLQNKPMTIFGSGHQTRAFSYIDDVAPYIAIAPQTWGAYNRVFNVGSDEVASVRDIADCVAAAFGVEPKIEYLAARNEVNHIYATHHALHSFFNVSTPVSIHSGIIKMAEWVYQNGARSSKSFDNIEILKNLPPSWKV